MRTQVTSACKAFRNLCVHLMCQDPKELEKKAWEIIAKVSHDLRTPLTSIKESILLVLDRIAGDINQDQERFLSIAKNNVERLESVIKNMLKKLEDLV